MTTRRERMERRAEKRREWAEKRTAKATAAFNRAHEIGDMIPLGQPILTGHHSQRRHERDLSRIDGSMRAAVESSQMADHHSTRADGIERQLENSIFSDDPDAIERLRERIAGLEAERDRMKAINREVRRGSGWAERVDPPLTDDERTVLADTARFSGVAGYPAYALSNLGANIRRNRERLERLEAEATAG